MNSRPATSTEIAIVEAAARSLPDAIANQILFDVRHCSVEPIGPDSSRRLFHIAGLTRVDTGLRHKIAEGTARDADGAFLTVLLFGDELGRLLELEFVRYELGQVLSPQLESVAFLNSAEHDN